VGVFGGNWQVGPSSDELTAKGLLGQSAQVSLTNGQALLQDLQVLRPTVHLRGRVVDNTGAPVGNIMLIVNQATNSGGLQINPQTAADGSFDAGVFGGTWNLSLECSSASERGLVPPQIMVSVVDGVDRTNLTLVARAATRYISGQIRDSGGNPVTANTYASIYVDGTNYNACGGGESSSFQIAVFDGTWQVGISGDVTGRGYDNPPSQTVTVGGGNGTANFTLYPLGQTPPRLGDASYANGQFQFSVWGSAERMYRIEMTTNVNNPASWTAVRTNTAFGGMFTFTDMNATGAVARFYRAVLVQ